MKSDHKQTPREETERLDARIIRLLAAHTILPTKVVALRLNVSYWRVYRAILRNSKALRR